MATTSYSPTKTGDGDAFTIMHGNKDSSVHDITKYALFMGGTNVIHEVLRCYDPLRTGYGRLFMVRKPVFLTKSIPNALKNFKHILEYGNTQVQGLNDIDLNTDSITGGYVGKQIAVPTVTTDNTNTINITVYEFSGSPVRQVIDTWINGISDKLTGLTHMNGINDGVADNERIPAILANMTAEFIYINTDVTGEYVEYACLLANCFPTQINIDAFNYQAGQHGLVEVTIPFSVTKYESIQINKVGKALLDKFKLLSNSLNFNSMYPSTGEVANLNTVYLDNDDSRASEIVENGSNELGYSAGFGYNVKTGQLDETLAGKYVNTPIDVDTFNESSGYKDARIKETT